MSAPQSPAANGRLLVQVEEAARVIAPLWPLGTSIAVNPLWDLRELGFRDAIASAAQALGITGYPSAALFGNAWRAGQITPADLQLALAETAYSRRSERVDKAPSRRRATGAPGLIPGAMTATINREVAKWCAAYLGGIMPDPTAKGFYQTWRSTVARDPSAARLIGSAGRSRLANLPARADDALADCLERLGITEEERIPALVEHLTQLPGWAGHAKWRSRWAAPEHPGPALHLVDYLAVRVAYHSELAGIPPITTANSLPKRAGRRNGANPPGATRPRSQPSWPDFNSLPDELRESLQGLAPVEAAEVLLTALEGHYRDHLLASLDKAVPPLVAQPVAQVVCCIDVRSEGLRRRLEATGDYETFGFAGFFALPMRYWPLGTADPIDLCPVLLRPSTEMTERPAVGYHGLAERQLAGRQAAAMTHHAFKATREAILSPFVLAEAAGLLASPLLVAKTLAPARYQAIRSWANRVLSPAAATVIDADPQHGNMSDAEQALFAETALTTMGLTAGFAPLILLCGHGSTTENNPYASALDCGACGANRGGSSARAAAAILNRTAVRELLAERGIKIPSSTWFVASEHDTATDNITVFDSHLIPVDHRDALAAIQADLSRAGAALADERSRHLPGTTRRNPLIEVAARSADWAELQPEWGLARNAAFIVAPRSLTAGVDLGCRAFLHSYEPGVDPDGTALETILTAPMVVAHWINAQYYFSTVDPEVYAAGDKMIHNIVAGVGVVQGAGGDLQLGLPIQSLFDGERPYHEPLRLLTVVQAPLALLDAVIARNPVLRQLFNGQWVHLVARHNRGDSWLIRRSDGSWTPWIPAHYRIEEDRNHG